MIKRLFILTLFTAIFFQISAQELPFYKQKGQSLERRVEDLISRLTLDEKLSLLEHQNPAIERLGLEPYSWWNEALHGVARNGIATVYPMPIALAATFDPEQIESVYSAIADEAVLKNRQASQAGFFGDNTGLTFFTPNINIFRDPRWGRGMETFGEDPYLTAHMGLAAVNGLQGTHRKTVPEYNKPDSNRYILTAACLKHLAVHSGPEGARHHFDAKISNRDLWTTYLAAFEYIIRHSNVQQVMCAYNRLNGEPCCTNRHLLVDILRNRWNYDGILVTDCWALNDCWEPDTVIVRHRTHPSAAAAASAAFGSEVDLECGSGLQALHAAVDSGYITEKQIDEHLRRVLSTRFRINPEVFQLHNNSWIETPVEVAQSSIVMLKNSGVLPIAMQEIRHIAVVGPNIADSAMALGNYNGTPPYMITIEQAFRSEREIALAFANETFEGDDGNPLYDTADVFKIYSDTACHLVDNNYSLPDDFWENIEQSDVVFFAGGLSPALEGEELQVDLPGFYRGDRTTIELPDVQRQMLKEIRSHTDKPIVLILCTGSAIALQDVVDDVDAILVVWYGGQEMGKAVTNTVFGYSNSFGRLPVTFYRSTSQLPDFADYDMCGRTYRYMTEEPLYPFGYGLSYSQFHYDSVSFDRTTMTLHCILVLDSIDSRCVLGNGKEVTQVYLIDNNDTQGPRRQLVAIQTNRLDLIDRRVHLSIPIESEWLRRYNPDTDTMELPPAGTRLTLQIYGGPEVDFTW